MSDDDPFAAAEESAELEDDGWGGVGTSDDKEPQTDNAPTESQKSETQATAADQSSDSDSTQKLSQEDIPPKFRREGAKDNRSSVNFYLSDDDRQRIDELVALARREFSDEKVSKLDVYAAAFRSDLSDDDFLKEMRKIGYDYWDD